MAPRDIPFSLGDLYIYGRDGRLVRCKRMCRIPRCFLESQDRDHHDRLDAPRRYRRRRSPDDYPGNGRDSPVPKRSKVDGRSVEDGDDAVSPGPRQPGE